MDWPTALSVEGSLTEETEAGRLGQVCEADCMSAETEHKRACVRACVHASFLSTPHWRAGTGHLSRLQLGHSSGRDRNLEL